MNCVQCHKSVQFDDRHFITGMCWDCYKIHQRRLHTMQFPEGMRLEHPNAPLPPQAPPMRNPSVPEPAPNLWFEPVPPLYVALTIGALLMGLLIGYTSA